MAEILPRHYIIGILIFTFIIVGGVSILGIFNDFDPTYAADEKFTQFNTSFNKINDVTTEVDDLESSISDVDPAFGLFGVLNALISSAWQTLRLLFTSLGFMDGAYNGMAYIFGIPSWIPGIIISIITVIISFAIFSAIFQKDL